MKILHTAEFYYPFSGGVQEAVKQISEGLVKLGHEVYVATSKVRGRDNTSLNGVTIKEFNICGDPINGYSGDISAYQEFLKKSDFDVMMNYAAQQWATDLTMEILTEIPYKKTIVPCGFSGLYLPGYQNYFKKMAKYLTQYDSCIFLSNDYRDINFARDNGVKNIVVIPNGANEEEFKDNSLGHFRERFSIPKNLFLILHVGSHTGLKGHWEAIEIFKKARIKDAVLFITGNEDNNKCTKSCHRKEFFFRINPLTRKLNKRLIVAPLHRDQVIQAFLDSDLFLFPSNVECSPIVLFESIASRTPFLTSDAGNAKEIVQWTKGGIVLPTNIDNNGFSHVDIPDSVKVLEEVYHNRSLLNKLKDDGYNAWKSNFTWEIVTKRYEKLYKDLLKT